MLSCRLTLGLGIFGFLLRSLGEGYKTPGFEFGGQLWGCDGCPGDLAVISCGMQRAVFGHLPITGKRFMGFRVLLDSISN